jgi:hypothetical protein
MLEQVVHHTYVAGRATDVSGHGNHGVVRHATAATVDGASSLWFDGGRARVDVPPGPDLRGMRGIRVRARVRVSIWWWWWPWWLLVARIPHPLERWSWRLLPGRWRRRRMNLVEGHLSFALVVHRDGSIAGTVNGPGGWQGVQTGPGLVRPGRWCTVEFGHDGLATAAIGVDGVTVATSHVVPGPIPDVGPVGVTVGHWPEDDHRYSLRGWVDAVEVWTDVPVPEPVDPCCGDPDRIDDVGQQLIEEGWDTARAKAIMRDLEQLEGDLRIAVAGGDAAVMAKLANLSSRGAAAVARKDTVEGIAMLGATLQLAEQRLGPAQLQAFLDRAGQLGQQLPFQDQLRAGARGEQPAKDELRRTAAAMCLPQVPLPDGPRADHDRGGVTIRVGDPDTDGRPGGDGDGSEAAPGRPHDVLRSSRRTPDPRPDPPKPAGPRPDGPAPTVGAEDADGPRTPAEEA